MLLRRRKLRNAAGNSVLTAARLALPLFLLLASVAGATTEFKLVRTVPAGGYTAGSTLDLKVTLTIYTTEQLTALGLVETLPSGWTFNSVLAGGNQPDAKPLAGASGTLDFAWLPTTGMTKVTMTYRVNVPAGTTGVKQLTGMGVCRLLGLGEQQSAPVVTYLSAPKWVDFAYAGTETGSQSQPYNTLAEGVAAVATNGAINFKGNTAVNRTGATARITKAMTLNAIGGAVVLGRATKGEGDQTSLAGDILRILAPLDGADATAGDAAGVYANQESGSEE